MSSYVSALDLIDLSNEVGNALVRCDHAINQLQLGNGEPDFETIWQDVLDIQFWHLEHQQQQAAKSVCEQLIKAAIKASEPTLTIDDDFINDCIADCQQLEFDF